MFERVLNMPLRLDTDTENSKKDCFDSKKIILLKKTTNILKQNIRKTSVNQKIYGKLRNPLVRDKLLLRCFTWPWVPLLRLSLRGV